MDPQRNDPWRLSTPPHLVARIRQWIDRATEFGIRDAFVNTITDIHEGLRSSPHTWGDPVHRLRSIKLLMCHRIYRMVHTTYGIHDEARIVFVKTMSIVGNHPLAGES